jgi:hypothetical protein
VNSPIFDRLRSECGLNSFTVLAEKLVAVSGDVTLSNVGMSTEDFELVKNKVSS